MFVLAFFTEEGTPKEGLSPTIRIRDISTNALIVTDAPMVEVGDGFYKYNFIAYSPTGNYSIRSDGGPSLNDSERYVYAGNEAFVKDITNAIWNEQLIDHLSPGSTGEALNKTSNATIAVYFGYGS